MNQLSPERITAILGTIRTAEDAGLMLDAVKKLAEELFRAKESVPAERLLSSLPQRMSYALLQILSQPEIKESRQAANTFFVSLHEAIKNMEILKIEIAIQPTGEIIDRIAAWVGRELGSRIILDIQRDASLLGGARLIFRGRYKEISLPQFIDEAGAREKEAILRQINKPAA